MVRDRLGFKLNAKILKFNFFLLSYFECNRKRGEFVPMYMNPKAQILSTTGILGWYEIYQSWVPWPKSLHLFLPPLPPNIHFFLPLWHRWSFSVSHQQISLVTLWTLISDVSTVCHCVLSVCVSLPEVPDLAGGRGLDLPHSAGAAHGSGQLGHGLRHRLLPRR